MNTDEHGHESIIFCDRFLMIIDVIFAVDILKKFKTIPVGKNWPVPKFFWPVKLFQLQ